MRLSKIRSMTTMRAGMTLVEMLVALALSVFMMAILSEAFVSGLKSFAQLKALGDLDDRLRTVANVMRRDLRAPHFEGTKRLSECTSSSKPMPRLEGLRAGIYNTGNPADVQAVQALIAQLRPYESVPPRLGFFSIEEWPNLGLPTDGLLYEGSDTQGRPSYRDVTDVLHFSARLDGSEEEKFFYGALRGPDAGGNPSPLDNAGLYSSRYDSANNRMYSSQWTELFYFLAPDNTAAIAGVGQSGGPVQTFNLYRRRLLLIPDQFSTGGAAVADTAYQSEAPALANAHFYQQNDVSAVMITPPSGPAFLYNTPADVQHRARRYQASPPNPNFPHRAPKTIYNTTQLDGGDLLLTNVISFDVKVWDPFAYRLPQDLQNPNPAFGAASGRGAYVDIGEVQGFANVDTRPTAWTDPTDALPAVYAAPLNPVVPLNPGLSNGIFDTGTLRQDGVVGVNNPDLQPAAPTHRYPFNSIQITIRVYEPKSKQTRQITIIQDM
jgi:hypothetical protein